MKTVAGTPNSRDHTGARAPLLSHATARPQHAGTSFESQAQKGRQAVVKSQHAGTSQRYEPGSLPSRPGPQRLLTIGRLGVRSAGPSPSLSVAPSIDVFDYLAGYQDVPEPAVRVRECRSRSAPACSCLDRRAAAAPLSGVGNALPISGPPGWPAASRTAA